MANYEVYNLGADGATEVSEPIGETGQPKSGTIYDIGAFTYRQYEVPGGLPQDIRAGALSRDMPRVSCTDPAFADPTSPSSRQLNVY